MQENPRGFGYWLWRAPLILHEVNQLPDDEILIFLDAGCELNVNRNSTMRLVDYCEFARRNDLMVMETKFPLEQWCKIDVLVDMSLPESLWQTGLYEPGVMAIRKSERTISLLNDWIDWMTVDNYHYLDDSPSRKPELPTFEEHRHDQAILTCLLIQAEYQGIEEETFFPDSWRNQGRDKPFWAARNSLPFVVEADAIPLKLVRALRKVHRRNGMNRRSIQQIEIDGVE